MQLMKISRTLKCSHEFQANEKLKMNLLWLENYVFRLIEKISLNGINHKLSLLTVSECHGVIGGFMEFA